jgi:hypothetical protein
MPKSYVQQVLERHRYLFPTHKLLSEEHHLRQRAESRSRAELNSNKADSQTVFGSGFRSYMTKYKTIGNAHEVPSGQSTMPHRVQEEIEAALQYEQGQIGRLSMCPPQKTEEVINFHNRSYFISLPFTDSNIPDIRNKREEQRLNEEKEKWAAMEAGSLVSW